MDTAPVRGRDVFATDAGVEGLFTDAGFGEVHTVDATYAIAFADVEEWRAWSMGTSMRALWARTPTEQHPEILQRATALLDGNRGTDGQISVEVDVRYTLGRA